MAKKSPEEQAAYEERERWLEGVLQRAHDRTLAWEAAQERARRRRVRLIRILSLGYAPRRRHS